MKILLIGTFIVATYFLLERIWGKPSWERPTGGVPDEWKAILKNKVGFYRGLKPNEKALFEYAVQEFLLNCKITGIDTKIDLTDKLLIGSSAVIPIFAFPEWKYTNLSEVLVYPNAFDENFNSSDAGGQITGMVGTGYMNGKMILSKKAIHLGFANETDKKNTAIHEFVHLIDKADGATDGIPELLMERQYTLPWLYMIKKEMDLIYEGKSDINPYGGTNKTEFFAVASEYFFERPKLLEKKHPELFRLLTEVFSST